MVQPEAASHLDLLRSETDRVAELLAGLDERRWDEPVPTCPGWDVLRLTRHLCEVHAMVTGVLATGRPPADRRLPAIEPPDLTRSFHDGAERLLRSLRRDPTSPTWSFDPLGGTVGFWQRRMAMETAVHRVDLEGALGLAGDVPARLSGEGISEVIEVMIRLRIAESALVLPGYGVDLIATDSDQRWRIAGPESADTVGTAEGASVDLFLMLWKRRDPAGLRLTGQRDAVLRLLELSLTP